MFSVTMHAIERHVDRIDPSASESQARRTIRAGADTAVRLRGKTRDGNYAYYQAPDGIRFVVAEEPNQKVIVTVLLPHEEIGPDDRIPELARELATQLGSIANPAPIVKKVKKKKKPAADNDLQGQIRELREKVENQRKHLAQMTRGLTTFDSGPKPVSLAKYERQRQHALRMEEDRSEARACISDLLALAEEVQCERAIVRIAEFRATQDVRNTGG